MQRLILKVSWITLMLALAWIASGEISKWMDRDAAALRVRQNQQVIDLRAECEALGGVVTLVYRYDEHRWAVSECSFP